jgi:DNA-binding NtrC family response regulator
MSEVNSSRLLVIHNQQPDAEIKSLCAQLEIWHPDNAPGITQAREMLTNYHTAIVVFDSVSAATQKNSPLVQQLEQLISDFSWVSWIAALPEELLANDGVSELISHYFFDYITTPLPSNNANINAIVGHAMGMASLRKKQSQPVNERHEEHQMVGTSSSMLSLFNILRKFAEVDAPVLVTGESGTGKELMASAIHERSPREHKPFIAVNCGAIPENLLESELFGYEKGAFSGAYQRKMGRIEAAQGGTLFLDEVGDLPLEQQVKLLRFLQEGTIERLGSTANIVVDVRVIAATNIDLQQSVSNGTFREDLYYRLHVLHVEAPPLRERGKDIEILANFFLKQFSADATRQLKGFSRQALISMNTYHWPGNVRELINRIRRALVMSEGSHVTPNDLDLPHKSDQIPLYSLEQARSVAESRIIEASLLKTDHNLTRAAKMLGVSRMTLYRLIDKYQISTTESA